MSSAHEEGGERVYSVNTERFLADADGNVRALVAHQVEMVDGRFEKIEGTDFELPCELVLLAMGFLGPQREGLLEQLGVELDERSNVPRDASFMTSESGVFACGDMGRGQSLIVWAIAEGRSCAAGVDALPHGRHAAARADPADGPPARLTHNDLVLASRTPARARVIDAKTGSTTGGQPEQRAWSCATFSCNLISKFGWWFWPTFAARGRSALRAAIRAFLFSIRAVMLANRLHLPGPWAPAAAAPTTLSSAVQASAATSLRTVRMVTPV